MNATLTPRGSVAEPVDASLDVPALVHLAAPVDQAVYTLADGRVYRYDASALQSDHDEFPDLPAPGGAHGGTAIRWADPKPPDPPDPKNPPRGVFVLVHEPGVLRPEWYGSPADLAESNAAQTHAVFAHVLGVLGGRTLRLQARTYDLTGGLFYSGTGRIEGEGTPLNDQTTLRLVAPADYVLKMQGQGNGLANLTVDANRLAPYAVQEASAPYAERHVVKLTGATRDGVRLLRRKDGPNLPGVPPEDPLYTNNDAQQWSRCAFWYNGTAYLSRSPDKTLPPHPGFTRPLGVLGSQRVLVGGTAAVTAGSAEVVGTGTAWTTLGLQPGDALWIEGPDKIGTDFVGEVSAVVSDTRIRLRDSHVPSETLSGRPFALLAGCGWRDERHGDNNICQLNFPFARGNAHAGVYLEGLYGHALTDGQFDYNGVYGIQVGGRRDNPPPPSPPYQDPVFSTEITKPYLEDNGYSAVALFYAVGVTVTTPLWSANGDVPAYLTGGPEEVVGVVVGDAAAAGGYRAVTPIGRQVP